MRIEQENRGPLGTEAVTERIECRVVDLWQAVGSGNRTAEGGERLEDVMVAVRGVCRHNCAARLSGS